MNHYPLPVYPFVLTLADPSVDLRDRFVFFMIASSSHSLSAFLIPRSFQIVDFGRTKLVGKWATLSVAIVSLSCLLSRLVQSSIRILPANSRIAVRATRDYHDASYH